MDNKNTIEGEVVYKSKISKSYSIVKNINKQKNSRLLPQSKAIDE